ncbi:MAG: PglZ domain-containing protein [Bacteroidota bacterium]
MGAVSEYLKNLLAKQVEASRIVVWFDPERHYAEVARSLDLPGTTVVCYEGSFFALRREVDPLLEGEEPPRLLVYVPMAEEESDHALAELTAAGVVMKPGQNPWQRNTRLSLIARNALKPVLGDEAAASIEKQVEAGQLSLADLDSLASGGGGKGVISVLFGTGDPREVALAFLREEDGGALDQAITEKKALHELGSFLGEAFGVEHAPGASPGTYRGRLARHILSTEFITALGEDVPQALSMVGVPQEGPARQACVEVARMWRSRTDALDTYVTWADDTQDKLLLPGVSFTIEQLASSETFRAGEQALQEAVERELLVDPRQDLVDLARRRRSGFWAKQDAKVLARWALIELAGQLLLEADHIEGELKGEAPTAAELVRLYATGEHPWCLLDTYQRHMERHYLGLDPESDASTEALEKLVFRARERYVRVGNELAQRFVNALRAGKYRLPGFLRQVEVYAKKVGPAVEQGRVAYILVDALRFETARELASGLAADFGVELEPAVAAVPTITEIGMAALLPRAGESAAIVPLDKGRVGLSIDGATLADRASRVKFLASTAGVPVCDVKLDDLLPRPGKKVRDAIQASKLVLVTSQEIDVLCEKGTIAVARSIMDDIPYHLARACRSLARLGIDTIVIAADHGYLFGDETTSDMKIDPPGGETLDLHRRVWVGRGGTSDLAFVRARATDFCLGGDLELAVPLGFGVFKVQGGGEAYFHGGLSLQELMIPVMVLVPKKVAKLEPQSAIQWKLVPGSKRISTRFFSVQVQGQVTGLFEENLPRVRVEIRSGAKVLSRAVSASYDFDESTGTVGIRMARDGDGRKTEINTVALMLTQEPPERKVTIHLFDADTRLELARLEDVEVAITI